MAASRSRTAMAMWSISVSNILVVKQIARPSGGSPGRRHVRSGAHSSRQTGKMRARTGGAALPAEAMELVPELRAQLRVGDAVVFARRQGEHGDLALVHVVVHLVDGLAGLREGEHLRHHRMDQSPSDQPVGLERLLVV